MLVSYAYADCFYVWGTSKRVHATKINAYDVTDKEKLGS